MLDGEQVLDGTAAPEIKEVLSGASVAGALTLSANDVGQSMLHRCSSCGTICRRRTRRARCGRISRRCARRCSGAEPRGGGAHHGLPADDGAREAGPGAGERNRTPTHEEAAKLYADLKRTGLRLGLLIGWKTGARIGEIASLRWCDVYANADGAWVSFPEGKTGPRVCPIADEDLREILTYRPAGAEDTDLMFSPHFAKNGSATLVVACEERKIAEFTFHGLRRLMTDTCQRRGVDVGTYAAMVGHTPEEALRAYRRPTVDDLRVALLKIRSHGTSVAAWLARHGMLEDEAVAILEAGLQAWREQQATSGRVEAASEVVH